MAKINVLEEKFNLVAKCLPIVAADNRFSLKGGTAINLFLFNLPRISTDIDLTYQPIQDRRTSLMQIDLALKKIGQTVSQKFGYKLDFQSLPESGTAIKLDVHSDITQCRIEVNPVLRGSVYSPELLPAKPIVESKHGPISTTVASTEDVIAGKMVAALDRQHPRDLYDVYNFLNSFKVTDKVRTAFMVFLICHNKPTFQVLNPNYHELDDLYDHELSDMMYDFVSQEELESTRHELKHTLVDKMPDSHKEFLIGFLDRKPDWSLLNVPHAKDLPGVRWRQINLDKAPQNSHDELMERTRDVLGIDNSPSYPLPSPWPTF